MRRGTCDRGATQRAQLSFETVNITVAVWVTVVALTPCPPLLRERGKRRDAASGGFSPSSPCSGTGKTHEGAARVANKERTEGKASGAEVRADSGTTTSYTALV